MAGLRVWPARIAGWPATLTLSIHGVGDVLFCHATPRNDRRAGRLLVADRPGDRTAAHRLRPRGRRGSIRRTAYPQASEFADGNVLRPPSAEQVLDGLTKAELR
jgi:hypothetical protein